MVVDLLAKISHALLKNNLYVRKKSDNLACQITIRHKRGREKEKHKAELGPLPSTIVDFFVVVMCAYGFGLILLGGFEEVISFAYNLNNCFGF